MKVLPSPCKQLDLHVVQMTQNGGSSSSERCKNIVPNYYFRAKHIDTRTKRIFFTTYALYLINKCAELLILKFFKLNTVNCKKLTYNLLDTEYNPEHQ